MDFTTYPQFVVLRDRHETEGVHTVCLQVLAVGLTSMSDPTAGDHPKTDEHGTPIKADALRDNWLDQPKQDRLGSERPDYDACMTAHRSAAAAGSPGYRDPTTGLFVMTATYLRDRGWCCDRGCRHCPYD